MELLADSLSIGKGSVNAACHEASMARMDADAARSARAKVESELARVQNDLAVLKEAR